MPLAPPPRDSNSEVVPHDHDGILPDDGIIRRISEHWVILDQRLGRRRISSIAFKASSGSYGGMSVDLQREIEEAGLNARTYVSTPKWIGSIRLVAGEIRSAGFRIGYHPLETNPYHGEVWGKFTKAEQQELRNASDWFVPIPGVEIS